MFPQFLCFSFASLFLFLCLLTTLEGVFYCVQCRNCNHRNFQPQPCEFYVTGCITARVSRDKVVRDCYSDEWMNPDRGCNIKNMANSTCQYCDDRHGCNVDQPDALVCRSCDWTRSGTCDVQRVCRSPFRTTSPQCYILYRNPFGFHFGCFDEMSNDVEFMLGGDPYGITWSVCDSNDCNWHAKNFWTGWEGLLAPFRMCYKCVGNGTYCGPKVCDLDNIYSHFCLRVYNAYNVYRCLGDVLNKDGFYNSVFSDDVDQGKELICNTDLCNYHDVRPDYLCSTSNIYRPRDGCAVYKGESRSILFISNL